MCSSNLYLDNIFRVGQVFLGKAGCYLGEGEGKPGHVSPQMKKISPSKSNVSLPKCNKCRRCESV